MFLQDIKVLEHYSVVENFIILLYLLTMDVYYSKHMTATRHSSSIVLITTLFFHFQVVVMVT